MRRTRWRAAWVGPVVALAALNACSNVQASAAYCEQARLAEAAMLQRVQLYTALAAAAPPEIRDKARTLQDAFARLYNALKAIGFDRTRANGDSAVRAVLDDAKVTEAVASLQGYGQKACGIPSP